MKIDSQREVMVFGDTVDWSEGSVKHFTIGVDTAMSLTDEDYLDPTTRQNQSPTADELIELVDTHGGELYGYMVSPNRDDARITLEGAQLDATKSELLDIIKKYDPDDWHETSDGLWRMWWN